MYFEIYKDAKGEYRWRLKAANHEIIAQGEGYTSIANRQHAVDLPKALPPLPCKRGIKPSHLRARARPTRAFLSVSDFIEHCPPSRAKPDFDFPVRQT